MILKAKERGDGKQLGHYLLKVDTNEHAEIHELRGFTSNELPSALHEIDAISRGTRAKNYLFSMSLNPPPQEKVPVAAFESAIDRIEQRLGLTGQPRTVVFHENNGRRHAHAVWSRIDTASMKAVNLSHYKLKLREISRELYLEHGWQMPRGLMNSKERDPLNFTHAQWEQAKRTDLHPKAVKAMFRECWAVSDSSKAFAQALKARGFTLARGDRRGHVAVDYRGEVYAIAKYADQKTKDVRARLGDPASLPSVEEVTRETSAKMSNMLKRQVQEVEAHARVQSASIAFRRRETIQRQREERVQIEKMQAARWEKETAERSQRLSKGFRGLWDRLTGKYAEIRNQNEREALQSLRRDRAEKDDLIFRQMDEKQALIKQMAQIRQTRTRQVQELHRDIASFMQSGGTRAPNARAHFNKAAEHRPAGRGPSRDRDFDLER